MKVKVPKQIKIVGRNYSVRLIHNLNRDESNRACVYWHKQEIQLDDNLNLEQQAVSFLHECLHAIDEHVCGRANLDEVIISGLAEGLYQFLQQLNIEFDWSNIGGS